MISQLPGVSYPWVPKGMGPTLPSPRLVVLHCTDNPDNATAMQEAEYAHNRTDPRRDWTSAHFYVDSSTVVGSVPLDQDAWAAPPVNGLAWQIEMCGRSGAVPATTVARTAALVGKLTRLAGIPVVHLTGDALRTGRGVCGHLDVNDVWHQSTHTDPGADFNWASFIDQARAAVVLPPTLRRGATGPSVIRLQHLLNSLSAGLVVDGVFGPRTEEAVRRYQQSVGIAVDGVVGPVTWTHLLYL